MSDAAASPKHGAIYARLSTDDKEQISIPRQIDQCKLIAAKHGYVIQESDIFVDDGYSGYLLERPDLTKLLVLARARSLQALFVADGDRLSREYAYDWLIRHDLRQFGVTLMSAGKPLIPV